MPSSEVPPFPWVQGAGFSYRVAETGEDWWVGSQGATTTLRNSDFDVFLNFYNIPGRSQGSSQPISQLPPPPSCSHPDSPALCLSLCFLFFVFGSRCVQVSKARGRGPRGRISALLPRSLNFNFVGLCLHPAPTVCSAYTVLSTNNMSACAHGKPHVSVRVPSSLASPCSRYRRVNNKGQGQGRGQFGRER